MCIQILETVSDRKQQTKSIPHPSYKYMYIYYIAYIPCILYVLHLSISKKSYNILCLLYNSIWHCSSLQKSSLYCHNYFLCQKSYLYCHSYFLHKKSSFMLSFFVLEILFSKIFIYIWRTLYLNLFYTISVVFCY